MAKSITMINNLSSFSTKKFKSVYYSKGGNKHRFGFIHQYNFIDGIFSILSVIRLSGDYQKRMNISKFKPRVLSL